MQLRASTSSGAILAYFPLPCPSILEYIHYLIPFVTPLQPLRDYFPGNDIILQGQHKTIGGCLNSITIRSNVHFARSSSLNLLSSPTPIISIPLWRATLSISLNTAMTSLHKSNRISCTPNKRLFHIRLWTAYFYLRGRSTCKKCRSTNRIIFFYKLYCKSYSCYS